MTEKSNFLAEKNGQYSFYVSKKAGKVQVKKALEKIYGVEVVGISTMILGGGKKKKKYTNKGVMYVSNPILKKAVITLKKGQTLDYTKTVN